MEYKIATLEEYIAVWEKDIAKRPHKKAEWEAMRDVYIPAFKDKQLTTFIAKDGEEIIAQISVVTDPNFKEVKGLEELCDGKTIAHMNAFRCDKEYEGQGHISKLVKMGEQWAKEQGFKYATIGASATNVRNIQIYFHFGYTEFVLCEHLENGKVVLNYKKEL